MQTYNTSSNTDFGQKRCLFAPWAFFPCVFGFLLDNYMLEDKNWTSLYDYHASYVEGYILSVYEEKQFLICQSI